MKERVPYGDEDRERPGEPPAPADHPSALALQLQRTAGNQATARLLQRVGVMDILAPGLEKGFEWVIWNRIVRTNRDQSSYHAIDPAWRELAGRYSLENPADGAWIRAGIMRMPDFWVGGWILERAGSATHAITLDDDVFFNPDTSDEPNVDTYVHELVHVAQYGILGITGFLGTYAEQFVEGYLGSGFDDAEAYHQIAHERQAAAVEARFSEWRQKKEKADAEEEAKKPKPPDPIKEAEEAMRPPSPISEVGAFPLSGSVGAHGANRPDDVARVAGRLHGLGFLDPLTTDIDAVTEAIERYQFEVLRWRAPDGRVDIDKRTHTALKAGRKTMSMQLP
jgi:Domain of unknown function (DUF4157)